KYPLLFLFILLLSTQIFSQSDYAVTSKGDTLRGATKILTYDLIDRVQVKINNKKNVYTALEVKAIFVDGVIYHTVKYDKGYRYMKLIKPGFLSLYGFRQPNQPAYDGQFLVMKNGTSIEVPNLTFKKSMANFLSDCAEVAERIKSGDLGKRDMDQIIDRYNSCLQFKTEQKIEIIPAPTALETEKRVAVNTMISKVEASADFAEKADVFDLLKDLRSKVGRNEILPNYLIKDIKKYLGGQPQFGEDLEKLLAVLAKK
ncbi:MAG: hypothetical protein ORN54_01070, partial [Cyclobacteriaceae bacterium]|nr:hypothetical protein [Cyclobacteriaceae bacterium]